MSTEISVMIHSIDNDKPVYFEEYDQPGSNRAIRINIGSEYSVISLDDLEDVVNSLKVIIRG